MSHIIIAALVGWLIGWTLRGIIARAIGPKCSTCLWKPKPENRKA